MTAKAREKISLASEVTSIVSVIPVVWLGLAFFSVSQRPRFSFVSAFAIWG